MNHNVFANKQSQAEKVWKEQMCGICTSRRKKTEPGKWEKGTVRVEKRAGIGMRDGGEVLWFPANRRFMPVQANFWIRYDIGLYTNAIVCIQVLCD